MKANRSMSGSITIMACNRPTTLPRQVVSRARATARRRRVGMSDLIAGAIARELAGELKIDLAGGAA
jgi:hypothetical protein